MSRNTGDIRLPRRRRATDPMTAYDSLPAPLRRWLAQAALPWSPSSARRIWVKSMSKGHTPEEALSFLQKAEIKTLAREKPPSCFVERGMQTESEGQPTG